MSKKVETNGVDPIFGPFSVKKPKKPKSKMTSDMFVKDIPSEIYNAYKARLALRRQTIRDNIIEHMKAVMRKER